jgi:hypothetical protein
MAKNALIKLSKVVSKEVLGYAQVLNANDESLTLNQVQGLEDTTGLRAFVRGTNLNQFDGELEIADNPEKEPTSEQKAFRDEVIAKMAKIDEKFEFVKFFNTSTKEKTNMGFYFNISDMV